MREKIFVFSFIILAMSIFVASEAFAECRPGMSEVTIANPAGKVITRCVPDEAVDHIGGPSDIFIPATCPCWDTTSIDQNVRFLQDVTCDRWVDDDEIFALILRDDPPPLFQAYITWWELAPAHQNICNFFDVTYGVEVPAVEVSYDEAQVCYEILVNSDMWAANNCN
jgi:hypothetical protein